jgi:diguanylate cyclase (GGDEF)-like protein
VGNQVIAQLGEHLRARVRSIDAAARFGGDEFALVLSETDERGALALAAELRQALSAHEWPCEGRRVTVSLGVAEWHPGLATSREVVAAADAALYRAKRLGKDRACAARHEDESGPEEAAS